MTVVEALFFPDTSPFPRSDRRASPFVETILLFVPGSS